MGKLSIANGGIEVNKTKKSTSKKVEKFTPKMDVDFENGKLVISASLELDFNDPKTLEILENLQISSSGKGYNCSFAQVRDLEEFSGQFSLNIKADKMLDIKNYAQQMSSRKTAQKTPKKVSIK